uniref:Uncharacterized protein n=1 Tax=Biomphalaria glabrata TaxID=6526 RepID=A0A2C9M3D9_BIOGL
MLYREKVELMPLLEQRIFYKPFEYPWAYDAWLTQQKIMWFPEEVSMADDVKDWNTVLTKPEKNLLTQIFRFFTQADVEVHNCYMHKYSQVFKVPEICMMLAAFANMEGMHAKGYSYLLDTVGMPEIEYQAFMHYKEMKDKYECMQGFKVDTKKNIALTMAVFGGFTEGVQLFASFAMLINFQRFGKMKGMGQIVAWSIRDETLHTISMIKLLNTFINENPEIWDVELQQSIIDACNKIVTHEDAFIDLAFELGPVQGLTKEEVKSYIRFIANRRLMQMGLKPIYDVQKSPLEWLDEMQNGMEYANFF